jgi:protein-S-isoprenylcysteine O-methyltransferase Ste14
MLHSPNHSTCFLCFERQTKKYEKALSNNKLFGIIEIVIFYGGMECIKMRFVLLGCMAFIFMYLFDVMTLKNKRLWKSILGLSGLGLMIFASIEILYLEDGMNFPVIVRILGGIIGFVFLLLLIYSLFLEVPFKKTYGEEEHNVNLVDTGTYAICRHPGVIWFFFFYLGLYLMTGRTMMFVACITWTILDVIYVILQEKTIFNKMFKGYGDYQRSTPMLIPNKTSIQKMFSTMRG